MIRKFASPESLRSIAASAAFAASIAMSWAARAQTPPAPTPGDPRSTVPEKIEPPPAESEKTPKGTNETLSDKLQRGRGVIRPPDGITPDMRVPAPVPEPNTTPVIPPPGTPGNPAPVAPK